MYMSNIWKVLLLATCAYVANSTGGSDLQNYRRIDDVAASRDVLYVADGNTLHLLRSNLTHLHSVVVGNTTISKIALSTDETFIAICLIDGQCKGFQVESLLKVSSSLFFNTPSVKAAVPKAKSVALAVLSNSSFYFGSDGFAATGERTIILRQFGYNGSTTHHLRTTDAIVTNSNFISRDFYNIFKYEHFIYFVAVDNTGNRSRLTVLRVCDDKTMQDEHFSAVIEIELKCGKNTPALFNISGSSLISHSQQSSAMLMISISSKSGSRVCGYQLADINEELRRAYNECISTGSKAALPWADYDGSEECTIAILNKQEVTECSFGSTGTHALLSATSSIRGSIVWELVDEITAMLSLSVDDTHLLYLAHTNTSGHYLTRYDVLKDMTMSLKKVEAINSAVNHLRLNDEHVYAATDNEVFIIELDFDCSAYTDCTSCVKNWACGWCNLESTCSKRTNCSRSHLKNRWTRSSDSCISHVITTKSHSAITPLTANLTFIPTSATFPEIDLSEEYRCHFVNSILNYSFTSPFVDGKYCNSSAKFMPSFGFKKIEVHLHIVSLNKDLVSFSANNTFTIHNCSSSSRCRECAATGVCGWCVYDNKCTGSDELCQTSPDWRRALAPVGSGPRCPALLTPKHGWYYLQPVGVSNKLRVYARDLPQLIPGYKYTCELRDPSGLSVVVNGINSTFMNESQVICQIEHSQVTIPKSSSTGVMALQLNLVFTRENSSFIHIIEWERIGDGMQYFDSNMMEESHTSKNQTSFNLLVYNCSYFGHDCSSCLAATSGTSLPCVWCHGSDSRSGTCAQFSECLETITIGSHQCPAPQITSVSPTSGHISGGTVVTISGSNLGVTVNDVSVLIGEIECPLLQADYKPGKEVVCTTNRASSEGEMTITVRIIRAQTVLTLTYNSFNYALPRVSSVYPNFGPVSGGTSVTISGSALNVGNMESIRVKIGERVCEIINITSTMLIFKTFITESVGVEMISIEYGSARINGGSYEYTPNPIFTSIFPHNTIPAGGVALNFTGHNLNVTQKPRIVIYIGNISYANSCTAYENTTLHCKAPILPPLTHILEIIESQQGHTQERERRNDIALNYTLIMDSAPGPVIGEEELVLTVKPNPVALEVEEDSKTYIAGSEDTIAIMGKQFDTVDVTEIKVYLGEYICRLTIVMPTILKCKPSILLITSTPQTEEIKVFVSSTLEYNVGYVQIINNGTVDNDNGLSQIIVVVVVVVIVITAVFAIAFCIFVIVTCRCLKNKSREFRLQQVPMGRNYFGGIGDNDLYDCIEDAPKNNVCKERRLNNYLYNINEDPPTNTARQDNRGTRDSLPQIPTDDYVDMQSHSIQLQRGSMKQNMPTNYQHQQTSRIGSTGDYVAMLPASRPARECNPNQDCIR